MEDVVDGEENVDHERVSGTTTTRRRRRRMWKGRKRKVM
jgi:hypothetical protein